DLFFQNPFSVRRSCLCIVLGLQLFESLFPFRSELARLVRFLWPTITREWLKVCRGAVDLRVAICIGAICIYVHVALNQKRFPVCFHVAEFEDRVAIKEIMPGNNLVQTT